MAQPATAGAIVAGIFAAIAVAYFGYRGYVKWHRYRRRPEDAELPPIRRAMAVPNAGTPPATHHHSPSSSSTMFGGTGRESKASLGGSIYGNLSPTADTVPMVQRHSMSGFGERLHDNSASRPTSPTHSEFANGLSYVRRSTDGFELPASPLSSSSSTMALKRQYGPSAYKGNMVASPSTMSNHSSRRDSYLPHHPYNRESIHIVPPQPLGIGFGGMATALDEKTLAFGKHSGIGATQDSFSSDFSFPSEDQGQQTSQQQSGVTTPQRTLSPSSSAQNTSLGKDQLVRYLQEGPYRSSSGTTAMSPGQTGHVRGGSLGHPALASASASANQSRDLPALPSSQSLSRQGTYHSSASGSVSPPLQAGSHIATPDNSSRQGTPLQGFSKPPSFAGSTTPNSPIMSALPSDAVSASPRPAAIGGTLGDSSVSASSSLHQHNVPKSDSAHDNGTHSGRSDIQEGERSAANTASGSGTPGLDSRRGSGTAGSHSNNSSISAGNSDRGVPTSDVAPGKDGLLPFGLGVQGPDASQQRHDGGSGDHRLQAGVTAQ